MMMNSVSDKLGVYQNSKTERNSRYTSHTIYYILYTIYYILYIIYYILYISIIYYI